LRGSIAHEVFDPDGNRYAGKFLHASRDGDASAAARFEQEAALLAGLEHPNLVRVDGKFEGRDDEGVRRSFVRMELVEGCGLDVLIAKRAPVDEGVAIAFGRQLAAGLAYAHGHGVVHRDLKPANVLVDGPDGPSPTLKIADFGMARASSLAGVDANALTILGTPDYMAPESLDPIAVDARADLYALGCILFELLTGEVPYPAATPFGILRRHRDDPIPPLPEAVSPELRALVGSLMAKSPADRPPSAGSIEERLGALARAERALVPVSQRADSVCASCGQALLPHLAACLNCGLSTVSVQRGSHSVVLTGPGEIGDKMDSAMRDRLLDWLGKNPHLGIDARKTLRKQIPRMPSVFVGKLSQRSAEAMAESLRILGFEVEVHEGSAIFHPGVRKKAAKLTGRLALITLTSMSGVWSSSASVVAVLGFAALGLTTVVSIGATRAVTGHSGAGQEALSAPLRAAFDRVEAIVPSLTEARHRHALRAVVRQSLDLREQLGGASSDQELARALNQASATTGTLARIDAQLRERDLHGEDPVTRDLLHRRDLLAGKMAQLSGALESLRIRALSGRERGPDHDALDELRHQIEALEEVQAL
jgi:hypothetical protein